MAHQTGQFEHAFRYLNRTVRLVCRIDQRVKPAQLVLDDVRATTQHIANSVPDWRIELEACKAAEDRGARYC